MARTIDQFIWQWQVHFRIQVQVLVEHALESAGAFLDPQVLLVGIATEPATARHPVCIEPETGPLKPEHLVEVQKRASEIYEADPERLIINTNPQVHEDRHRWLERRSRGRSIAEAIEASGASPGKSLFVSVGGAVGGFEVHTCIAVDSEPLASLPRLEGEDVKRFPAPGSFVENLIALILAEADVALDQRDPGLDSIRRSAGDLIARAADQFVMGCSFRTENFMEPAPCGSFDDIARKAYEGSTAAGSIVLVSPNHSGLEFAARFARPVSLVDTRAVRKLLEMCSSDLSLLFHEDGVYGLGRVEPSIAPGVFRIAFVSHATWELSTEGAVHLRSSYGGAALPSPAFDASALSDTLDRVLGDDADVPALTSLVHQATLARHGTTVVVSKGAAGEAERLSGQSTVVEPLPLTPELLSHLAQIDGAVLLDGSGRCHAIGVILDGAAAAKGDPSRGARYNSAVKYVDSAPEDAVVIVVSEDGDVMQVPELRRRVRRQEVLDAVTVLEDAAASVRPESFHKAFQAVAGLAFYLSAEQCDIVNELARQQHESALQRGGVAIVPRHMSPDPDLDAGYFID